MLRRDFLKFLGIVVPVVAIPRTKILESEIPELEFKEPDPIPDPVNHSPSGEVKLEFDFDGMPLTIVSHEGEFRYTEKLDLPLRLETIQPTNLDFEINLYVAWVNDSDFINKIKGVKSFNLTVTVDDISYVLKDAVWTDIAYDMIKTEFFLRGIVCNVRV